MNNIISLLVKEKKIFFTVIVASLTICLIYMAFLYYPLYQVETSLFIRNIPKSDVITQYGETTTMQSESGYSNPLFNLVQILNSEEIKSRVYQFLLLNYPNDLKRMHIKEERKWDKKYSKLTNMKIEPTTDVIKISLDWVDKDHASMVLSEIINQFKTINLEIRKSAETNNRKYLDKQLYELSSKLDFVRTLIRNYRLSHRAIDLDNESTELTRATIDFDKQVKLIRSQIGYNKQKLKNLESQLDLPNSRNALRATAIGEDPYLVQLNQNLAVSQQNLARLRTKYTDNYEDVTVAQNEVNTIKNNIQKRVRESLNGVSVKRGIYDRPSQEIVTDMARTQAEISSLQTQLKILQYGINNLKTQELQLPNKFFGLKELEKQEAALATAYDTIKQKQLEANIKENEVINNIFPLGKPTYPEFLINKIIIIFIEVLSLGLLAGLGIAWIKEDIEDKWSDSSEIQKATGVKILGILPWTNAPYHILNDYIVIPNSLKGMAYSNIASSIILKSHVDNAKALVFVSTSDTRDGSSIISNISTTFARLNKATILIDTDFNNNAKLLSNFNIKDNKTEKDLLDVIDEINQYLSINKSIDNGYIAQIIMDSVIPIKVENQERNAGFYYLGMNKAAINIHDYVATQGFTEILNFLKSYYEFILINTPAKPMIFPEFNTLASISDAVVIISSVETSRRNLLKTVKNFKDSEIKILGIIPREENSEFEKYFDYIDPLNIPKAENYETNKD